MISTRAVSAIASALLLVACDPEAAGDETTDSGGPHDEDPGLTTETTAADPLPPVMGAPLLQSEGYAGPESAVYSSELDSWFVSNIAGETGARDGQGWISRLDAEGQLLESKWLEGLDGPAGMAIADGMLILADIHRLVWVELSSARIVHTLAFEGAGLLNDVAVDDDGRVYVSDTFAHVVYRVSERSQVEVVASGTMLAYPNGLHVHGRELYIASTGPFDDMKIEAPLFRLSLDTGTLSEVPGVRGKFDAVEAFDGGLLLSDFRGPILYVAEGQDPLLLRDLVVSDGHRTTADFGIDRGNRRLLVPDLFGNRISLFQI